MREKIALPEIHEEEGAVCPACAAFIGANEVFCPACRAPISLLANTDPFQRIQTEGFLYGRAVEARPKVIILVGVWLLFFPLALLSAGWALLVLLAGIGSGSMGFVLFWVAVAAALFFSLIVYRVTKNYVSYERKARGEID